MKELYPLKFTPIFKHKVWGGQKLQTLLNKRVTGDDIGESWEISAVQDNISIVSNGYLAGNNLQELIEVYMGELVGEKIYEKFGIEFPLLIKFIDANDILSVQVHPGDKLAKERHNAYGKTEMWYVLEAESDAELIAGFNRPVTREEYLEMSQSGRLSEILKKEKVQSGTCFFIPNGAVHAIGAGVLLAEIQQTSDITYRIYDWDRKDKDGKLRELHTDWAIDAIDFTPRESYKKEYQETDATKVSLVESLYFTTNLLNFNEPQTFDYSMLDSFVVYMCVAGQVALTAHEETVSLEKGESVLIPASVNVVNIVPKEETKLLEVSIR